MTREAFFIINRKENKMAKTYLSNLPTGEEAREITDFPGYYVTDTGRVFSVKRTRGYLELKQVILSSYPAVGIYRNGKLVFKKVHRLVATEWYGYHKGLVVNHKDENKTNNRVENLEWITQSGNVRHGTAIARSAAYRKKYKSTKVLQLTTEGKLVKEWNSAKDIHRALSIRYNTIRWAIQAYPLEYNGYLWVRKELYKPHN